MILLANGCSFTWGGGLGLEEAKDTQKRLQSVWPHYLGQLLNRSVVNLSRGCGSNQRIIRTNLDWIQRQSKDTLANTLAMVQWTDPSRYEYYEPLDPNDYLENIPSRWARVNAHVVIPCRTLSNKEKLQRDCERRDKRLETHTIQEDHYKMITDLASMAKIFEDYGIKYYYWTYGHISDKMPPYLREYYKKFPWLNAPLNGDHNDHTLHWQYERVSDFDNHPSYTGHKQIAEIIYEELKKSNQLCL